MLRQLLFGLALTALLAGCSSPASHPASSASATLAPHAAAAGAPQAQQVVATRTVLQHALHVEGTTSAGACAGALSTWRCQYAGGKQDWTDLGSEGTPLRLNGTISWTATTPVTKELNVYLFTLQDGVWQYQQDSAVSGPSPLAFDYDLSSTGGEVAIGVSTTECYCALGAGASGGPSQDFTLDGTYAEVVLKA